MRVLVTGAGGFVGHHLARELRMAGHAPLHLDVAPFQVPANEPLRTGDLRDREFVARTVKEAAPDACVHLGGIAFVPMGWEDPQLVFSVNLGGTIHVLDALRTHAPGARVLIVSSSEVYGRLPSPAPLTEDAPMAPANPYAVSKMAADLTALLYARRYGMQAMTARPENHIGPGQSERFVASSFARQLAGVAAGRCAPVIRVGNLASMRDFTDARDVARAYRLLIEKGTAGRAYNIATGQPVPIRELLDGLCAAAGVRPEVVVDPERYRPADALPALDVSRIRNDTGWAPEIGLRQTLRDIYEHVLHAPTQT